MSTARVERAGADRRHVWALVLALLSIPGSTIAWDLPLGGLWIGLPLAVAAIALGVRTWPRTTAKLAVALAALALGQMAVYTLVSALS